MNTVVDLDTYPLTDQTFAAQCAATLEEKGVLVLPGFIQAAAFEAIRQEAKERQSDAYFCAQDHSVFLTPDNPDYGPDHPANKKVTSSKGCICDDVVAASSPLRQLYDDADFRGFIATVTGQEELHSYADPLSSINIHYANRGQELGWHFDNSSFAITLLIQKPDAGGRFEFVKNLRNAEAGEMNFEGVGDVLDGRMMPDVLEMDPATLVLFRGRNSIHRVSPNESDMTRILAVLAYNDQPNIELSESARMTFYGRLD